MSLQLLSSGCSALGYVLQKAAHIDNERVADPVARRPLYRSWKWLLGLLCMVVSAGAAVASAPLLNASVQATLGAATIVFNGVLAWLILGDQLLVLDALAILTIVVGTVVAMAGAEPSARYTYAQTLNLLEDPLVYGWVGVTFPLAALAIYAVEKTAAQPRESWLPAQAAFMAVVPALLGGWCNNHVLYAVKVVTTVMADGEWGAFKTASMYAYVAVSVGAVVGQVRWLNTGLAFFPPGAVVPVFQVMIIIGGSMHAIVYYHDLRRAPPGTIAAFACGAAICSLGIVLIQVKGARVAAFDKARADAAACVAAAARAADASAPSGGASPGSSGSGSCDGGDAVRNPLAAALVPATDGAGGAGANALESDGSSGSSSSSSSSRGLRISAMSTVGGSSRLGGEAAAASPPPLEQPLIASSATSGGLAAARSRSATAAGPRSRGGSKVSPSSAPAAEDEGRPKLQRRWFDLTLPEAVAALTSARRPRGPDWR